MSGMEIELNDVMGGAQVPSAMPIQLQGVLHEHIWNSFQQKVNALFAEETERVVATSLQLSPYRRIACLGFVAAVANFAWWLSLPFEEMPNIGIFMALIWVPFCAVMPCCIGPMIYFNRQVIAIQMEFAPRFKTASNEVHQQSPNVSLDIKREVHRMNGPKFPAENVPHNQRFSVLYIGVAGALGGGQGAGVGTPAVTPMQVEMGQHGGNYGNNFNTMPPASTPGMFGGSPLLGSTTCTNCFAQVPPGAPFCNQCGHKM